MVQNGPGQNARQIDHQQADIRPVRHRDSFPSPRTSAHFPAGSSAIVRALRQVGARSRVVALGFFDADQPVAVGVDRPELLVGADELLARNVAVAVAVHLLEPQRSTGSVGAPAANIPAHRGEHRARQRIATPVGSQGDRGGIVSRHSCPGQFAIGFQTGQQFVGIAQLAHAQPAVAVRVEQVEQTSALDGNRQRHARSIRELAHDSI